MGIGRFEGVSDIQWDLMQRYLPKNEGYAGPTGGMPPCDFRRVMNSILWVCITGAGWCQLPREPQFAPKTTAHRWLKRWSEDGTLERLAQAMIQTAELNQHITWQRAHVDGSFFPG